MKNLTPFYKPPTYISLEIKRRKMHTRKFEVRIYLSSFCTFKVEAKNRSEAIVKARSLNLDKNEILTNLENWEEADESELVRQ